MTKNTIVRASLGLILILSLSQCSLFGKKAYEFVHPISLEEETAQNKSRGFETFHYSKKFPFIIGYPAGSDIEVDISNEVKVEFTLPDTQIKYNVVAAPYIGELNHFIAEIFSSSIASFEDSEVLRYQKRRIGSQQVYEFVAEIMLESGPRRIAEYAIVRDDHSLFVLTFFGSKQYEAKIESLIEQLIPSFCF